MLRRWRHILRAIGFALLVMSVAGGSFTGGVLYASRSPVLFRTLMPSSNAEAHPLASTYRGIEEIWHILQEEYVDKGSLNPALLRDGSLKGLVEAVRDPHTTYMDPAQLQQEETGFRGSFEGIGAQVTMRNERLIVVAPIAGGPAERVGIRSGDWIVRVNEESTSGMTLTEAVDKIRGPRGTRVRLAIQREGEKTILEVELTREEVKLASVAYEMLPDGIAHIRISRFTERTNEELVQVLRQIRRSDLRGIILDLRNNAGGILDVAVQVTSQFLKEGIVLYQEDGQGRREVFRVKPSGLATDVPLAVLVNQGSASASEVVAGAIQDATRAPVIGSQTFGKGSVNHLRSLSGGGALYVTFARWFTPAGHQIEGQGLTPDIVVEQTREDIENNRDPPLKTAIAHLKG